MAQDVKKVFGEKLRELREKEGLTQAQLADILNISRATLGYYENAERTPDIETLDLAASYFKVTSDYLLGRTPNKTTDTKLQAVCEYIGLSEKTCDFLHKVQCFAKGQIKSQLYYNCIKKRKDEENSLSKLYEEYPELKQLMDEFLQCDDLQAEHRSYSQKHPFFDEAFLHLALSENDEDISYALRQPVEEAKKDLSAINSLLSSERIWDLTHLLVVYFFTDFTYGGSIFGTVTSYNGNDAGRFFTFTPSTIENGILFEIINIIKAQKKCCKPKYQLCDIQEGNIITDHNSDYFLKDEPIFKNKEGDPNG